MSHSSLLDKRLVALLDYRSLRASDNLAFWARQYDSSGYATKHIGMSKELFKSEILAEWPNLERSIEDNDVKLLQDNRFWTVQSIKGASRTEIEAIDLHAAITSILKPTEGIFMLFDHNGSRMMP